MPSDHGYAHHNHDAARYELQSATGSAEGAQPSHKPAHEKGR
jgi:hypothetical protein